MSDTANLDWGDGVQVLAWPGTGLSVWAVHTGRSSCWTTASSFHQPPSTRCSTVSARYVRPSHLLREPDMQIDCFVHWIRVFLISTRHIERIRGAFCDDALYKLTFTFTCTLVENREIFIPHVYLAHTQRVTPSEFRKMFDAGKTRVTGLPYSVKTVTIC